MLGVKFFKSSNNPTKKNKVLRVINTFKKFLSKIELSKLSKFKEKIIIKKLIKINNPPINEAGFECLFKFPSGLSYKAKLLEIKSNFIYIIELNKIINKIK